MEPETEVIEEVLRLAEKWRVDHSGHDHGLVVVWHGEVTGWISGLHSPSNWLPECFAVDAKGRVWRNEDEHVTEPKRWVSLDEADSQNVVGFRSLRRL